VVLYTYSRRIVGWAMATHLRSELVLEALDMALGQRRPAAVIHHSDQGSQYTSLAFGKRCDEAGVRPSMGSVGDCFDNAMCESFFATLECELLDRRRFKTQIEARMAIFEFIEGWYNPHRRHDSAAESIEHHGQVKKARPGRDVGYISDPQTVGRRRHELAVDQIRRWPRVVITHGGGHPFAAAHTTKACGLHQAGDPLTSDMDASH
jgi:hypothetical protein